MPLDPILAEVTARIEDRSADARDANVGGEILCTVF